MQTLGKVCTFENGDRGENYPGRASFVATGIPIINAGHLSEDGIDQTEMNFISRDRFDLLRSGKIRLGDVLFCLRGSLGKFAVNDFYEEGAIASSLIIIRPTEKLDVRFLTAYLQSSLCKELIRKYENGAAQPNLGGKSLEQFSIPIPPLDEQRRIVAVLNKTFEGIAIATANAQQNLTNARALFESSLQAIFANRSTSWQESRLGDVASRVTDGTHLSPKYVASGVAMLDSKHIGDAFEIEDQAATKFISSETDQELSKRCKPITGDILISSRGSIGKIAIVRSGQNFNIMGNMILVRLPKYILPEYGALFFYSEVSKMQALAQGVAQKGLYLNQIREYVLPVPPMEEQQRIVKKLGDLLEIRSAMSLLYRTKLAALAELKQSFLHKAFAGELT